MSATKTGNAAARLYYSSKLGFLQHWMIGHDGGSGRNAAGPLRWLLVGDRELEDPVAVTPDMEAKDPAAEQGQGVIGPSPNLAAACHHALGAAKPELDLEADVGLISLPVCK